MKKGYNYRILIPSDCRDRQEAEKWTWQHFQERTVIHGYETEIRKSLDDILWVQKNAGKDIPLYPPLLPPPWKP